MSVTWDTVTLKEFQDHVVDSVIELLIDNHIIDNISDIQRVVNTETGQITVGSDEDSTIILYQEDYQTINDNIVTTVDLVSN